MFTFWSKPGCNYCVASIRNMTAAGLVENQDYTVHNILENPDKIDEFRAAGVRSLPVFEYDGNPIHSGLATAADIERIKEFGGTESEAESVDDVWDDVPDVNFSVRSAAFAPVHNAGTVGRAEAAEPLL